MNRFAVVAVVWLAMLGGCSGGPDADEHSTGTADAGGASGGVASGAPGAGDGAGGRGAAAGSSCSACAGAGSSGRGGGGSPGRPGSAMNDAGMRTDASARRRDHTNARYAANKMPTIASPTDKNEMSHDIANCGMSADGSERTYSR